MRLRVRIRSLLALVALVALAIGGVQWVQRRHADCLGRAEEHKAAGLFYELAATVSSDLEPSWAAPKPPDPAKFREYETLATRHREAARHYERAATRPWVMLPSSPPEMPEHRRGFLALP